MQALKIIYIICASIGVFAILIAAIKSRRARKYLLISALIGVTSLVIVSLTSGLTGVSLPINLWTLLCASVASLPGVILMIAIKFIWVI